MYAPSSYNETVTGETLSSVSEKSESYSDSNPEYTVRYNELFTYAFLFYNLIRMWFGLRLVTVTVHKWSQCARMERGLQNIKNCKTLPCAPCFVCLNLIKYLDEALR